MMTEVPTINANDGTYRVPFAELFRDLKPAEERELRNSIAAVGVKHVVHVYHSPTWGDSCVIDGANRLRIGAELGKTVPTETLNVTDEEARRLAEDLNAARRQVTPEEATAARAKRIERVAEKRTEGKSIPVIAEEEGVSIGQVQRDIEKAKESGLSGDKPEKVTGKDGKKQPSTRQGRPKKPKPETPPEPQKDLLSDEPEEPPKPRTKPQKVPNVRLKDGLGNPVPDCVADTFGDTALIDCVERINAAHREILSIEAHIRTTLQRKAEFWPFAFYGESMKSLGHAADRIAEASSQLFIGIPFKVCPGCRGEGCKDCRNSGTWTRHMHESGVA